MTRQQVGFKIRGMGRPARSPRAPLDGATGSVALRPAPAFVLTVLILTVAAVVAAVYWPVLSATALFLDDSFYLTKNELVANPSWESIRPAPK